MDELEYSRDIEAINAILITTADLSRPYEVIGPIYFQTTNRGYWINSLSASSTAAIKAPVGRSAPAGRALAEKRV